MQKIIIGAGPVGLLFAHYLLTRGQYQMAEKMAEKTPSPQPASAPKGPACITQKGSPT